MVNGRRSGSSDGWNAPDSSQASYSRDSTAAGSYGPAMASRTEFGRWELIRAVGDSGAAGRGRTLIVPPTAPSDRLRGVA